MAEGSGLPNFPFEVKELEPEEKATIAKFYKSPNMDFVSLGPKKFKVMRRFLEDAANIYNMPLRDSDIFVVTYQRSGTTWAQELVWLLANNLDYAGAAKMLLTQRYSFLEMFMFFNENWEKNFLEGITKPHVIKSLATPVTETLLSSPSPRFIKSHLPMSLLPPHLLDTTKVVYVARDPRDVAVSSYHHSILFKMYEYVGTFAEFWDLFVKDVFTLTPFFEHIKEAWELRNHPNMLFLFYENLVKDLPAAVRRVADFLGKELTAEQVSRLCDHLSFENFKKNESVNFEDVRDVGLLSSGEKFIRQGKAGGWRAYFDEEMTQQAERWIADNLRDTDLRFPDV